MLRAGLLFLLGGCVFGAPPGFPAGEIWTFPLVDPLADGRLLTPVRIEGQGPYLFELDPSAAFTTVDAEIIIRADLVGVFSRAMSGIQIGDLDLRTIDVHVAPQHAFDADGRRIWGVIGSNVIADSLVFGFDRDRAVAWLSTERAFRVPARAHEIDLQSTASATNRSAGRGVTYRGRSPTMRVSIDGEPYDARTRLGDPASRLEIPRVAEVRIDGITNAVDFEPLETCPNWGNCSSTRPPTIGLSFFRSFTIAADWSRGRLYATPRLGEAVDREARFARWGNRLACSEHCAQVALKGTTLVVAPDPAVENLDLELIVQATTSGPALPSIALEIPHGSGEFRAPLPETYAHAALAIVDASPFPRDCPNKKPCVAFEP